MPNGCLKKHIKRSFFLPLHKYMKKASNTLITLAKNFSQKF